MTGLKPPEEATTLRDLVRDEDPTEVLAEARHIYGLVFGGNGFARVEAVFKDIMALFNGEYPGYRACNTQFHDFKHTTDCFLAMARLIHGAGIDGVTFDENDATVGLISSLMHDSGFIQKQDDTSGTGAKYTMVHVRRSIEFAETYFNEKGFAFEDFELCRRCLKCTGINVHIGDIYFPTRRHELLGKIMGTADLLGQLADRTYIRKLLYLYAEYKEAGVPGYENVSDLLRNTEGFYMTTRKRFTGQLGGVFRYMRSHFRNRWNLDKDLYLEDIEKNINELNNVIRNGPLKGPAFLPNTGTDES